MGERAIPSSGKRTILDLGNERSPPRQTRAVKTKLDLHVHTAASMDCTMDPREVISRSIAAGLDGIAVVDHGTAQGGLAAAALAPEGFLVIVGQEVWTRLGELLGLFLSETIPSHLEPAEAARAIKEQGGLVGVPHPFDTWRGSTLRPEALQAIVGDLDFIEVLNGRSIAPGADSRASAFASRAGLPVSAGSDAHSFGELGRAYMEVPEFRDQSEFLRALKEGRPQGGRSPLWVHVGTKLRKIRQRSGGKSPEKD